MRISFRIAAVLLAIYALAAVSFAQTPGFPIPNTAAVGDQKPGSVLIYNLFTSSPSSPSTQNTRISVTNTHPTSFVAIRLIFVNGDTGASITNHICLTASQTASFNTSDVDPGVTGYLIAIAVDAATGCPISFNYLVGSEQVKMGNYNAGLAA